MEQAGIRPLIAAEVDDMAMLRLIARESPGVALVPPVVVRDELERGTLVERARVPGLRETFYAVTATRRFANPLIKALLQPV
jgi:LysR family transcriptional activator of nhaA